LGRPGGSCGFLPVIRVRSGTAPSISFGVRPAVADAMFTDDLLQARGLHPGCVLELLG
jgi:hypothetical protein